jgi:hypothetical protein
MTFVPKRPRQAHVPAQQRSTRKPKRPFMTASSRAAEAAEELFEPNFADEPLVAGVSTGIGSGPIDTRPQPRVGGRRLQMVRGTGEQTGLRITPGQLPTYERSFLQEELRRITLISGGLLALILVLTILLR